ncbi:hypothetical protein LUZ60_013625 [Juncus effusus]|nr:hypothetical protein LUZ60_013625 [Juncus effusus]
MDPNGNGASQTLNSAFNFISQIPQKFQNSLKLNFTALRKNDQNAPNPKPQTFSNEASGTDYEARLSKQIQAWKNNPVWSDEHPEIKVTVPEGSLCNLNVKFKAGLPPDAIYNIIIDPENKRVFKNIKEVVSRNVLIDEGSRQVVELEQAASWRFLWWTGTIAVHVFVDQDRSTHTVKFKQGRTGFMKKFEGCWEIEPIFIDDSQNCVNYQNTPQKRLEEMECKMRVGSSVSLSQLVEPSIVPPAPISWYLRGITAKTVETLVVDLLSETKRLRELNDDFVKDVVVESEEDLRKKDIKERWRERRRNGRHGSRCK